jgi:hypothetical protein
MKAVTFQRFLSRPRLQRRKLHIFVPLVIMIIGWQDQSRIRLILLPNDKFGSE